MRISVRAELNTCVSRLTVDAFEMGCSLHFVQSFQPRPCVLCR